MSLRLRLAPIALLTSSALLVAPGGIALAQHRAKHARKAPQHQRKPAPPTERHVSAVKGGQPNVQALGALVMDETGHELFARNADKERPIASISKLAATLAVVDKGLELEELSTIDKTDVEVAKGGARSRLLAGMTLSNRDLLHAALMGSDNRAIPALGRAVKMTPTQLTAAMNAKAKQLGLVHTRFHEPTGLSTGNVSTPRETIVMLKEVIANPVLGPITRRAEYDAHPVGKPAIHYVNTDHFAQRGNVQVLGGKTGYNDDARYCLVIGAKIDARTYYMAFLGNEGKLTRFGDVARVADWVISHKSSLATVASATRSPASPVNTDAPPSAASSPPASAGAAGLLPEQGVMAAGPTTSSPPGPLPIGVAAPDPAVLPEQQPPTTAASASASP